VFATPGFYKLTGYTQDQVLGRNCRFLQGPGTDPKAVDIIRKAIATGADCTTCILNYKADGTPFWNQFFVAALRDSDNCIVNYVSWNRRTRLTAFESRLVTNWAFDSLFPSNRLVSRLKSNPTLVRMHLKIVWTLSFLFKTRMTTTTMGRMNKTGIHDEYNRNMSTVSRIVDRSEIFLLLSPLMKSTPFEASSGGNW
jgi:hypothetical protein